MVSKLTDRVWQFDLRGVNAYLVEDDLLTLVDAGTPLDADTIRTGLTQAGYGVGDVGRVLLTHYDIDHVGALAALEPALDAPVYVGTVDGEMLAGRRSPPLTNHKGLIQRVTGLFLTRPSQEIRLVEAGTEVGSFTAFHTPGHTPGHVVFVSAHLGVALLGDLVTESGGALEPSGWLISYDTGTVRDSISALAERAPQFEVACVGHGTPLTSGGGDALLSLAERV